MNLSQTARAEQTVMTIAIAQLYWYISCHHSQWISGSLDLEKASQTM